MDGRCRATASPAGLQRKRDSTQPHLTNVFAAMTVSYWIETTTAGSLADLRSPHQSRHHHGHGAGVTSWGTRLFVTTGSRRRKRTDRREEPAGKSLRNPEGAASAVGGWAGVLPSQTRRALLLAAECAMRENKGYYKSVAPDPGSCTRDIGGGSGRAGVFCLYTARCQVRRHVQRTVRTPGEPVLPNAISPA